MGNEYDPMLEFKNKQPCHSLSKLEILLHYYYYKIKIKMHDMIISFLFTSISFISSGIMLKLTVPCQVYLPCT